MENFEHHGKIIGTGTMYIWYAVGTVISIALITAMLRPAFLGFERETFVESHQYVESHRDQVLTSIEKYDELTTEIAKYEQADGDYTRIIDGLLMQQRSLAKRIRASLEKIPEEHHPSNTERFR